MVTDLNTALSQWLEQAGPELGPIIAEEIDNRVSYYPALQKILHQRPLDLDRLTTAVDACWALHYTQKNYLRAAVQNHPARMKQIIHALLDNLPDTADEIAFHLDAFVDEVVAAGFQNEKGQRAFAGGAALASLLLSVCYPDSFVDYPSTSSWAEFVEHLGYSLPEFDTHGQRIVWLCQFAQELAVQPVFQQRWGKIEPMWVTSALNWTRNRQRKEPETGPASAAHAASDESPLPPEYQNLSLAELRHRAINSTTLRATRQQRQSTYYARSSAIRAYALKRAAGKCEACGKPAPFTKPDGDPFLEVHHIERLADGGPDAPEAVIALCPNCHRRAHHAGDAEAFNQGLRAQVRQIETASDKNG